MTSKKKAPFASTIGRASTVGRDCGFRTEMMAFERRTSMSSVLHMPTMQDLSGESGKSGLTNSDYSHDSHHRHRASARISHVMHQAPMAHFSHLLGLPTGDEEEEDQARRREIVEPDETEAAEYEFDPVFKSKFEPTDMRCLALVAHNHMKPAMKEFVLANKNLLKKFMLTGTSTTMTMLKEVFGDDPNVFYGLTCTSGPLGGDAELVSIMVTERLGGCIFFTDPMSAHPHSADIECLNRQGNVHNIIMCPNPTTALAVMGTFRLALKEGLPELIPSFFSTLASPSVATYKERQAAVLKKNMDPNQA